jgi:hypothetical protein
MFKSNKSGVVNDFLHGMKFVIQNNFSVLNKDDNRNIMVEAAVASDVTSGITAGITAGIHHSSKIDTILNLKVSRAAVRKYLLDHAQTVSWFNRQIGRHEASTI